MWPVSRIVKCWTGHERVISQIKFEDLGFRPAQMLEKKIIKFIIWLAPRAGKINQIAHCDWLPERARWSHLARSGLPAVSRKQNFTKNHIINPLLAKFVRSRWLDIGLVLFYACL